MTTTPISDDTLAAIKAGLPAVTTGPWSIIDRESHGDRSTFEYIEIWSEANDVLIGTEVRRAHRDGGRATMQHIARLDPQTVASLIARLEAAEDKLAEAISFAEGIAGRLDHHDYAVEDVDGVLKRLKGTIA